MPEIVFSSFWFHISASVVRCPSAACFIWSAVHEMFSASRFTSYQLSSYQPVCSRVISTITNVMTEKNAKCPRTDEEPHVGATVQLLSVHFAQHPTGGHHIEQADYNPGVLAPQVAHRIGRIGKERLAGDDLDAGLFAAILQIFDRLQP